MSNILSIAVGGLNNAASRIFTNAKVIVNASSTSENDANHTSNSTLAASTEGDNPANKDVTGALVALSENSAVYGANGAVVKVAKKLDKALLDALA